MAEPAEQTYADYRKSRMAPTKHDAEVPPPAAAATETPDEAPVPEPQEADEQDTPPAEDDRGDEETPQAKARNKKLENRFKRLTDRLRSKDGEIAELRGEVSALMQMMGKGQGTPQDTALSQTPPADPPEKGRPSRDQYPDEDDYIEAVAEWKADQKQQQADRKRQRDAEEKRHQDQVQTVQQAYAERLNAAKSRYDDYDDVVNSSDIRITQAVTDAIVESEVGPDLVYHLAQHPDDAQKLNSLGPVALGKALARLEAKVAPAADEKPDTTPHETPPHVPPAPIRPVGSGHATPQVRDPGQLSYKDYKAARQAGRIR